MQSYGFPLYIMESQVCVLRQAFFSASVEGNIRDLGKRLLNYPISHGLELSGFFFGYEIHGLFKAYSSGNIFYSCPQVEFLKTSVHEFIYRGIFPDIESTYSPRAVNCMSGLSNQVYGQFLHTKGKSGKAMCSIGMQEHIFFFTDF